MTMEKRERRGDRQTDRQRERNLCRAESVAIYEKRENVPSFCQTAETFFLHLRKERKPSNEET